MRRALAYLGACALVAGSTFAANATAAHAPAAVRGTDCFDGPFAHNHASPGATCATGFWCLPGSHPAFPSDWCLAKRREHNVNVVVIDDSHTVHVNWLNVILVGYVNDGWGHGRHWPFNPILDRHFCQVPRANGRHVCAPVLEFQWTGGDNSLRHPPCLQDLAPHVAVWFKGCSPVGQGKADRFKTFVVWAAEGLHVPLSWQRIVGVYQTNKDRLATGQIVLGSELPRQHAKMAWDPEIPDLLPLQAWLR